MDTGLQFCQIHILYIPHPAIRLYLGTSVAASPLNVHDSQVLWVDPQGTGVS